MPRVFSQEAEMATKEENLNRVNWLTFWGARRICRGVLRILLKRCRNGKRSLLFPDEGIMHYE